MTTTAQQAIRAASKRVGERHSDLFARLSEGGPAEWSYWDGHRWQLFVQMPRDLDAFDTRMNLRTINLIRRQMIRRLRTLEHKAKVDAAGDRVIERHGELLERLA